MPDAVDESSQPSTQRPKQTKLSTEPYRGTRDFLPEEMSIRTQVFSRFYDILERFGFVRYDGPLLEPFELYEAKSSQEIVNEQLFNLTDRGGRRLVIRPEMTPTVARMIAANSQRIPLPARWYAHVNCHRYERPQRGRVREHWQVNADIFGSNSPECEVELFDLIREMMDSVGATPELYVIRANDRVLVEQVFTSWIGLDATTLRPVLRALDKWEKISPEARQAMLAEIDLSEEQRRKIFEYTTMGMAEVSEIAGPEATQKSNLAQIVLNDLCETKIVFDPLIVRAFEYYTSTVFEVFDVDPTNRRSLFGGGRYDNLVGLFKSERVPGVGFGMGDVTLFDFMETHGLTPAADIQPDAYVFSIDEQHRGDAYRLSRSLQTAGMRAVRSLSLTNMAKELKYCSRLGARFAVIFGLSEVEEGFAAVRDMGSSTQESVAIGEIGSYIKGRSAAQQIS